MRNYVYLFFGRIDYHNTAFPAATGFTYLTGADYDDCVERMGAEASILESDNTIDSQVVQGAKYLLLDKPNLVMITSQCAYALWANPDDDPEIANVLRDDSPRDVTWIDELGNTRGIGGGSAGRDANNRPRSSFRTKPITLSALGYLELLVATWELGSTSQGRRLGGTLVPARFIDQLLSIINRLKAGKITNQQALDLAAKIH